VVTTAMGIVCLSSAALMSVLNMEQRSRLFASELKMYFPL